MVRNLLDLGDNLVLNDSVPAYMVNINDEYETCFIVLNVRFILTSDEELSLP